ncbi:MAG: Ig-like domain-containing protein, partial [Clostridia bacterium]|nr:Ig-like domain-containing protein [Clostridia bacterium]
WSVTDSGIVRKPSENANTVSDSANMAILTYKKQKLSNYVLSVKYKQGSDSTAKSPIIGFGSDTVGKFASEQGGGIAAYVTADGKLKLWSNKFNTSGDYRLSYNVPNYDSTAEHQFKIIVGSTKVSYYIDGSLITTYVLKDYTDGYVYLACGSNQGTFKNFEISPLTGINYVSEVADVNVKLNTSIEAAKDKLPKSVDTTFEDGSKKKIDILEWSSETYDSNYSGKYKFTGKLNADSTLNPAQLDAYAIVEVSEVYDPDITRRYFFDSADDLDDFTAYYATEANPDIKGSGFKQVDWRNNWFLTDGMLKKANQGAKSDSANVAMLVLNKQKYKNFELTIDFKQGTESYRWAMVGFGAKKMGEFALSKDGGRVNYLQQEGVISGWSREYVTGWEYHKNYGAALENYERNAIHRMKITVLGSKVTIKVDDYPAVVTDAPENYEGGYIYLAVNGNSAMFDNLTIIDYDVKNRKITEVLPNEKIVYDHNDKFAEYTLPEIVNVKADDGRVYHMAVEWNCPEFRSNIPGIYKHVGKIIIPSNKFTNPKNLTGKIDLEVIVDYDPNTSIKYYFDSDAELDDFVTYYTKTTGNDGLKKVPTSEQWEINESGRIARINQEFEQRDWSEEFASTKISTLVWDVMQLENFEVEVDYKQGTNTWLWAMVVFGIKDPTKWIMNYTGSDSGEFTGVGGYACYAEQEGTARFWGDSGTRLRLGATLPGVVNYNRGAVNHMKINVVNGIVKIYINEATEPLAVETRTHDTKGKIALACGMNLAEFDNLKITALDSAGNPANVGMSGMVSSGTPGGNSSS